MFKALTLIETAVTLAILSLALFFLSPVVFSLSDQVKVEREAELVRSFFYQVQTQARFTKQSYETYINHHQENWCIIALAKTEEKSTACNCFNPQLCGLKGRYLVYHNQFPSVELRTNKLFPSRFMTVNGSSGNLEAGCLAFYSPSAQRLMDFDAYGVINVPARNARTLCKSLI
ncbi:hypothetical protein A4G20_09210 [Pasteurellaceae bacterium RH1A]|nr:hypothetical protein A4G20_09210 [Pasteurellaceae bacterium RH1A]